MITKLSRPYSGRWGTPTVQFVDDGIFTHHSFCSLDCLKGSCEDICCTRGEDVSAGELERIVKYRAQIEGLVGVKLEECLTGVYTLDDDVQGGIYTRIKVAGGACIFHHSSVGCLLHKIAIESGVDFRTIKPMAGSLFPVTFNYGLLRPSDEILWNLHDCTDKGVTLFDNAKDSLRFYFGDSLVDELSLLCGKV